MNWSFTRNAPGVFLCALISVIAWAIQFAEESLFGHPYVEALVISIVLGIIVRTWLEPGARYAAGIGFSAKTLLEIAVMLLGASLTASALSNAGLPLLAGIVGVVLVALIGSYLIGRSFGLSHNMALLVASGNAICGNSAIAAVASAINADSKDIASSIAFTAVIGVLLVLILPLAMPLFGLDEVMYGVLAGLTVYAVPQVLAATAPVSTLAVQIGTLVKLVRVVLLGPVVVLSTLVTVGRRENGVKISFFKIVPWFVIGFVLLSVIRSLGLIPYSVLPLLSILTKGLTIIAMAALGLGVNVRTLRTVGRRTTLVVSLSIAVLFALSLALVLTVSIN